jgi:hypothetical protein
MRQLLPAVAALCLLGCHKAPAGAFDPGLDALRSAGLKVDAFQPVDPRHLSAIACQQGMVEGLDALLCDYGGPQAWVRGKKGAEEWIGSALTGTWAGRDALLLVVADRAHADPNGKTMQKIVKAFSPPQPKK